MVVKFSLIIDTKLIYYIYELDCIGQPAANLPYFSLVSTLLGANPNINHTNLDQPNINARI